MRQFEAPVAQFSQLVTHTDVSSAAYYTVSGLEPATPYTAEILASLGSGVTRNFTIPNIVAGKEVNMAAYQATITILSSEVILALLIITTINIFILGVSIAVFLVSQTW